MEFNPVDCVNHASDVTPGDDTVVDFVGLWVGTGGDVALKLAGDSAARTFKNVPDGTEIRGWNIVRVMASGTTATDIRGLR